MAKKPARIIKALRAIDHPTAPWTTVGEEIDVAPMTTPPKILFEGLIYFRKLYFGIPLCPSICSPTCKQMRGLLIIAGYHDKDALALINNSEQRFALGCCR